MVYGWPKWKNEVHDLFQAGEISESVYHQLINGTAKQYKTWSNAQFFKAHNTAAQPDPAHKATDKQLQTLEKKIDKEYKTAVAEMEKKLQAYRDQYNAAYLKELERLKKGEITQKEYEDWARRHMAQDQHLQDMTNVLSKDMHNANTMAHRIARDGMPDVYALNGNYATYMIEQSGKIDTGFTLYNHDAAESLLREKRQLMPGPSAKKAQEIAQNKDMQWNKSKIQSACLQSVLQGESPYDLAERLRGIATMNENASIRYARTMTTSVQNSGRYDAFKRAKSLGVDLISEWNAILDNATRHDHRQLHGQRREVGDPFEVDGIKIYYPAQSDGPGASDIPQSMIWNCRCTILAWVKGFEGDTVHHNESMGAKSFSTWQTEKAPKQKQQTQTPQPAAQAAAATSKTQKATQKAASTTQKATQPVTQGQKDAETIKKARSYSHDEHMRDSFSWDTWNDTMTEDERDALQAHTGSWYINMNKALRGLRRPDGQTRKLINDCTDALNHTVLKRDTKLYRGMGSYSDLARALGIQGSADVARMADSGQLVGMRFIEKGFCSTGIDPGSGWTKDVVLEITAPKGTKGMFVDEVSRCQGEEELLLQRGAIFEIHNATQTRDGTLKLSVIVRGFEKLTKI